MRLKRPRGWVLPLIMLILSVVVIGGSLAPRLLDMDTYKAQIIAGVRSSLNRELSYESGEFSFTPGPGFTFNGVRIKEKDGASDFVRAERLRVGIALFPLLEKKIILTYVELERPVLNISRDEKGVFNVSDLLEEKTGGAARIEAVKLKKGALRFTDRFIAQAPFFAELTDTTLAMNEFRRGKECHLSLTGTLHAAGKKSPVSLAGVFRVPTAGTPITETKLSGKLKTGPVDAAYFLPYYGRYLPFRRLAGQLQVDVFLRGKLNAFKSKGTFQVSSLLLDYPQVFHARLVPRLVKGAYELELTDRDLDISSIKVNLDGVTGQGNCKLGNIYGKDPRITARAAISAFNFKTFHQYIPYGIIATDTSEFIEQKIRGGIYRLDDARLDGRVSQIIGLDRAENSRILSARAHVEDGVISYGPAIPTFNRIRGELEIAGRNVLLKGMSGNFGGSPFTLEGSLDDYAIAGIPVRYPFTMQMRPRQQEAAWLLGHGKGEKLVLADGSLLKLQGDGSTSHFNLKGEWDLANVAYQYRGSFAKPAGRANTAAFQGTFTRQEFILHSLAFHLAPLDVAAAARYRYGGAIAVEIRTNHFSAAEITPLVPALGKYQPAGKFQATLHGRGKELENLSWEGEVALAGASLKPWEKGKPLTSLNGTVRFGGESVESSQLSGKIGNSTFNGKGSFTGFKSPVYTLSFTSPSVDLSDFGLGTARQPIRAERVQGTVSYREGTLSVSSLSCQLGHSQIALKGTAHDPDHPHLDLQISSSHLELEDLTALSSLSSGRQGPPIVLKAGVYAAEGRGREIPFRKLRCTLLQEDGILYLQGAEASLLDGEITGKVRMDPGQGGQQPRYQVSFVLQKASADKLLRALGVKRQELTGTVTVTGDLTAKGESADDLKKSSLGSIKIRAEHGTMRRFSVLSKVFSILNVSQLLKFHLPDMVSGGMPYKKITGDIAVKDGVATTTNLFVDSDAINISTVGKVDLVRNQLDLTIGVQPLQTVDKVVSKIPIVGWILTGKDKSLVTTYFEAKGPIEDPKVTAVPVKSLAKGVFNIFKRVFELPARLITDTGEVVIGR